MLIDREKLQQVPFAQMNEVHFEEVDLVNKIYRILEEDESNEEAIIEGLEAFLEHTVGHFSNEERLMQEHSFFAFHCHKGAHDLALERIRELIASYKSNKKIDELLNYFEVELIEWLTSHIATMDTVTATYLSQRI